MIAPNTQTVGQSLTLQCEVTTVRGISSRVDTVWSSDGTVLSRINDTTATAMDNSLVYTDSYTISQLNATDDGRVIQCEVVINTSPSVLAINSITLNLTSECGILISVAYSQYVYQCNTYNDPYNLILLVVRSLVHVCCTLIVPCTHACAYTYTLYSKQQNLVGLNFG